MGNMIRKNFLDYNRQRLVREEDDDRLGPGWSGGTTVGDHGHAASSGRVGHGAAPAWAHMRGHGTAGDYDQVGLSALTRAALRVRKPG
jgi:hypothetical protein